MSIAANVEAQIDFAAQRLDIVPAEYKDVCQCATMLTDSAVSNATNSLIFGSIFKTFGLAYITKQKAKAVRYVSDVALIKNHYEHEDRCRSMALTHQQQMLLIETGFQERCDALASKEKTALRKLDYDEKLAIRELEHEAELKYKELDLRYQTLLKNQEILLLLHRDLASIQGINQHRINAAARVTDVIVSNAAVLSDSKLKMLCDFCSQQFNEACSSTIQAFVGYQNSIGSAYGN